jgi:hypothetical protein
MATTYGIKDAYVKHEHCELVIYWNKFPDGRPVPGLYCKEYGTWIQWLDLNTAFDLIDNHHLEVVLNKPKKQKNHPVKWKTAEELGI